MSGDTEIIRRMLSEIEMLLDQLNNDDGEYLLKTFTSDPEYRMHNEESWSELRSRLREVAEVIEYDNRDMVNSHENDGPLGRLHMAGLSGAPLRLKYRVFEKLMAKFRVSGTSLWLGRLLDSSVSFLGSLSMAFPQIEAVKEGAELIGVIKQVRRRSKNSVDKGM